MDKEERYTYHIDEYDEFDWCVIDNTTDEDYVYLEDITKVLNKQNQQIADLEAKLAESENKIYELMTKLNMKEYAPVFCRLAGRECEELETHNHKFVTLADLDIDELQAMEICKENGLLSPKYTNSFRGGVLVLS